jgi:hypothetical protein
VPEALESWPLPLFERLLPRHMQLVYAHQRQLLKEARATGKFDGGQIAHFADRRRRRAARPHGQSRLRRLAFASTASPRCIRN